MELAVLFRYGVAMLLIINHPHADETEMLPQVVHEIVGVNG